MSPKEKFQKTLAAKPFAEMAAKPEFQTALDYARLHMADQLRASSFEQAGANAFRLEGANQLATILQNLASPGDAPSTEPIGHLKGNI